MADRSRLHATILHASQIFRSLSASVQSTGTTRRGRLSRTEKQGEPMVGKRTLSIVRHVGS